MTVSVFGDTTVAPAEDIGEPADQLAKQVDALAAAMDTLARMERRDIHALSALDTFATALRSVSQHLAHVRQSVHADGGKLDALAVRLEAIESRLGAGSPAGIDLAPLAATLDLIGQRLAGLENKLDALPPAGAPSFDAEALAAIADRLARLEAKIDRASQQPALEPEATSDLLASIASRVSRVEEKVDSGADGRSIAACLMALDRRLSRIEAGMGMERPLPALADVAPEDIPGQDEAVPLPEPLAVEGQDTMVEAAAPGAPGGKERVDHLLEQVFRVLAR